MDRAVEEDVAAILRGMQRAEDGYYWTSRLRRGE
jgi:hypothetical protein